MRRLVVASVAPIGSIVRNVAGGKFRVEQLVPEGKDVAGYMLPASDAQLLDETDAVFLNGLGLDEEIGRSVHELTAGRLDPVYLGDLALTPAVPPAREEVGGRSSWDEVPKNPYLWMSFEGARRYAALVAAELSRIDPAGASDYRENASRFATASGRVEAAISETISTVPPDRRILFSGRDAFSWFAREFGIETIGFVNGPTGGNLPGPGERRDMADRLRSAGARAVFKTGDASDKVVEEIGRAADVSYVELLRYQTLPGPPGSLTHTYFGMMIENARTFVSASGGRTGPLGGVRPNDVV